MVATYLRGEGRDSQGWFPGAVGLVPSQRVKKLGLTTTLIRMLSNKPQPVRVPGTSSYHGESGDKGLIKLGKWFKNKLTMCTGTGQVTWCP